MAGFRAMKFRDSWNESEAATCPFWRFGFGDAAATKQRVVSIDYTHSRCMGGHPLVGRYRLLEIAPAFLAFGLSPDLSRSPPLDNRCLVGPNCLLTSSHVSRHGRRLVKLLLKLLSHHKSPPQAEEGKRDTPKVSPPPELVAVASKLNRMFDNMTGFPLWTWDVRIGSFGHAFVGRKLSFLAFAPALSGTRS